MSHRLRIHHKLLVVSVLILLPLVAITTVSARRQWRQSREVVFTNHREMAEVVGQVLTGFLQNFADTQEAMAIASEIGIGSRDRFHTFIREVARTNHYLQGFAVIAADGTLVNSSPPLEWWRGLRDRSDLVAVRSGSRWAVSNLQHAADGTPVVTVTTSLSGRRGLLLRSVIDVRALNDLLNLKLRPGWRVMIVDARGRLIYHTLDPDRRWDDRDWRRDSGVRGALEQGRSRREGYRSQVDGEWCLASYTRHRDTGWVVGSSCPTEIAMAPVRAALVADCIQIGLALMLSLLLICLFGRRISRPIEQLADAATAFGRGERTAFVHEDRPDEVGVLARALNTMASRVQERFDREHTIASTLQRAFLPERLPDVPGYTLDAAYHPALRESEVGGDFYDVFSRPDGCMGLLLGDVSGKGLDAATYATMARYMTRAYASENSPPAEVLQRLNRALCSAIEDEYVFVTAFYGILEPKSGTLSYSNAGHWPPLLGSRKVTEVVGGHGIALGVSPEAQYEQGHLQLAPGDTLLLFTDGLVEVGGDDPMDHLEIVQETLARRHDEPPSRLLERLHREACRRGGGAAHDDVALLALRRNDRSIRYRPEECGRSAPTWKTTDQRPVQHPRIQDPSA